MKKVIKWLLVITCLYVFIAKIYVTSYYIINQRLDIAVQFVNIVVLCSCVYLSIAIWRETRMIKYKIIWIIALFFSIIIQLFYGLFDYLSRDVNIDKSKVLYLFDLPNLLSVAILGYTIMIIVSKKRK